MLVNIIFFLVISSGSIFCAAGFGKKYEEILPVTCLGYSLILFLSGLLGNLIYGFYAVIILSVLMYVGFFVLAARHKGMASGCLKRIIFNIMTPGFFFFLIFYVGSGLAVRGLLAHNWDEFSHWIDIVKVMSGLDDFGTNSLSHSACKTYPPIMSLFQYLMQKIFVLIHPGEGFIEWRCYFAWQVLFVAVFLPLFSKIKRGQVFAVLSLAGIILLLPSVFYEKIYSLAYIDPFLSVLVGSGFSAVIVWGGVEHEKDIFYSIYIWLIIAALVLTKDAGMLFALFLTILYILDYMICTKHLNNGKAVAGRNSLIHIFVSAAFLVVPKILWNFEISISNLENVYGRIRIDGSILLDVVLGRDASYRSEVVQNYVRALFDPYVSIGNTGISFNYMSLLVIEILFLYIALKLAIHNDMMKKSQAQLYVVLFTFQIIVFVIGMCITYIFNFSEYESVRLASFARYENIVFLASAIVVAVLLWNVMFCFGCCGKVVKAVFLAVLLVATPGKALADDILRINYTEAKQLREKYEVMTEKIESVCSGSSAVYIISQEDSGLDKWILKFNIRPNTINEQFGSWSIGEGPFYNEDVWTVRKSCGEWKKELVSSYDYVALYHVNDYFRDTYGKLFKEPDAIQDNSLFCVNKNEGCLEVAVNE